MRWLLTLALTLDFALTSWAECNPDRMVKIVYRDVTPGIESWSFPAQPKTLYRLGTRYGRVEEAPDEKQGIHGLVVVNEPDVWMVNLATKQGRHIVDTGAPYHFRAPIVGGPGDPPAITRLESGCELVYMKAGGGSRPKTAKVDGRVVDRYEVRVGEYRLVLSVSRDEGTPIAFAVYEKGGLSYDMRYVEYEAGLEPRMELFQKPDGIEYEEPK
jgi:hypothetical protein